MPTWETTRRFERDWRSLDPDDRRRFRVAVGKFAADVAIGRFRKGLRVRRIEGTADIFEMTWAPNGRATFQYGQSRGQGPRVIWRRVGTHEIYKEP